MGRFRRSPKAFSTMELLFSILITAIVMGIIMPAMIYVARVLKGIHTEHIMLQEIGLFTQRVNEEMTRATQVDLVSTVQASFRGFESEYVEDSTLATGFRFDRQVVITNLIYEDGDGDHTTILDNRLVMLQRRESVTGTLISDDRRELIRYVSPLADANGIALPVFTLSVAGGRPFIQMLLRVGDRTRPTNDLDNTITGPFHQGFYLRYAITPTTLTF